MALFKFWAALTLGFVGTVAATSNSTKSATYLRSSTGNSGLVVDKDDETAATLRKLGVAVDQKTVDRYKAAPEGYKLHPSYYSETYLPRMIPFLDESEKQKIAKEYGSWKLVDSKEASRPGNEFYDQFPNRDVPREKWHKDAWQTDKDYLDKFLPEAIALTERAMEAILDEYGRGKKNMPNKSFAERSKKFQIAIDAPKTKDYVFGWIPQKSFNGLKRRLLHSIMAQDRFTIGMTGHSAAAGHGNLYQQSYTLTIQQILEPIMARFGVKMVARNFGMGGLGTQQTFMAVADLMGEDLDIVMWDSGMTEKDGDARGVLAVQGIIGCDRAPLMWFQREGNELHTLHEKTGADVAVYGTGNGDGWPKVESVSDLPVPWAAEYFACPKELQPKCRSERYVGKCWESRKDFKWEGVDLSLDEPPVKQKAEPGGRAGWHPGNREHQLQGRALTFPILQALNDALTMWKNTPDYAVPDSEWHVTEYYKEIKDKLIENAETWGNWCEKKQISKKFCKYPAQGRTESTPRALPWRSSIRSIVTGSKSPTMNPDKNLYDPPDVQLKSLVPPEGEVNVWAIVENGVDYTKNLARVHDSAQDMKGAIFTSDDRDKAKGSEFNDKIEGGKGWANMNIPPNSDGCTGEFDSFCKRAGGCLNYGHNDSRGGIVFDGFAGWIVMKLPQVRHGVIVVKMHSWMFYPSDVTKGWTSENNAKPSDSRALQSNSTNVERMLKPKVPDHCKDFKLEYAIDGKITSMNLDQSNNIKKQPERVVELWTLLDDDSFSGPKDVEVAMRMTGCGRQKIYELTHIYWI